MWGQKKLGSRLSITAHNAILSMGSTEIAKNWQIGFFVPGLIAME
jgi:hypothetical protein